MYSEIKQRADKLVRTQTPEVLAERKVGLEKESLRVMGNGGISQADHPEALGDALTHPFITTDFSEALLEMVTPPCGSAEEALHFLTSIHQFIVHRLPAGEHIWNTSMPCILRGGASVRIGEYGSSHSGQMKHAYRRGLGLRYGRRMQAIAGVHFNFSMPESSWPLRDALLSGTSVEQGNDTADSTPGNQLQRTEGYFQMMQNLLRIGWIVPYLFGASPAICQSFLDEGEGDELDVWNGSTRYGEHATSLRMGKIGYRYREDEPIDLSVRHTDLQSYIEDIISHVSTEHPPYKAMGVRDEDGEFQQLSTCRLQIENEFYSTVRPKQIAKSGELPIHALGERGIRYLELRSVDVNLLDPAGVGLHQIAMLEMLMMFAWLATPEPLGAEEMAACSENVKTVAHYGRQPGLQLQGPDGEVGLQQWGASILEVLQPIAQWLDQGRETPLYVAALQEQQAKFDNPDLTPSALMIAQIKQTGSFFEHSQMLSVKHHESLYGAEQDETLMAQFLDLAEQSRQKQEEMEAESEGDFETFLAAYLGQIHTIRES
ncbi:glutamate--cysteine ligase [Granulosicoccus antarcticus]|uniref:glutamate--cysteine ligase n=1 Tax=Granulosicoccus antarcticus TaxID=437505 RepID=UPI0012FD92EF|nr:glutamate--cysteine ligase [Granulosicoccus antarcticus]